ncbi:hypothetical protein MPSEU_000943100 [Mayamaea pseudoterrestris]|nr:hypothetical protein MPSEU_000943100 [Mayamaea pseudoterrestris]
MGKQSQSTRQSKQTKRKDSSQSRSSITKASSKSSVKAAATSYNSFKTPLRPSVNESKTFDKSKYCAPPLRRGPGKSISTSFKQAPLMFPPAPQKQQILPSGRYIHVQNENVDFSQLSESQGSGSGGFMGSVTMGQPSFSQPSSHASTLNQFAGDGRSSKLHGNMNRTGFAATSQVSAAVSRRQGPPPVPPLSMAPPFVTGSRNYYGSARNAAFGNAAMNLSFLPLEHSSVGPNYKPPFMQNEKPAEHQFMNYEFTMHSHHQPNQPSSVFSGASASMMHHSSQPSVANESFMPTQTQQTHHSSMSAPDNSVQDRTRNTNATGNTTLLSNAGPMSTLQSMLSGCNNNNQTHSQGTIDSSQIAQFTKEIFDAVDEKTKSALESVLREMLETKEQLKDALAKEGRALESKMTEKEHAFENMAAEAESKLAQKEETVASALDKKAQALETNMASAFDSKMSASESKFKTHDKLLDAKAAHITNVGNELIGRIKKVGGDVLQTAREARDKFKATKADLIQSVLSRLSAPTANMLRDIVMQHHANAHALASNPRGTSTLRSKIKANEPDKCVGSGRKEKRHEVKSPSLSSRKSSPPHPNPLDIVVKIRRSSTNDGASPLNDKNGKHPSSSTLVVTPTGLYKNSQLSQESKMTAKAPSSPTKKRKASTSGKTCVANSSKRRLESVAASRPNGSFWDDPNLGFSKRK